jgi:hypothetical protein
MEEFNPNHPVTMAVHDNWHKVAAMILWKCLGRNARLVVSLKDIATISEMDLNIVLHEHLDALEIYFVSTEEGEKLAREHGGMPA